MQLLLSLETKQRCQSETKVYSEILKILEEKLSVVRDLLHPVNWSDYKTKALQLLPECIDHVLELEDGRKRYCDVVLQMTKAFGQYSLIPAPT